MMNTWDLDVLHLPCMFSKDSPVTQFVLLMVTYPCFVVLLVILYFVAKAIRKRCSLTTWSASMGFAPHNVHQPYLGGAASLQMPA
jgi:hypothetical protein